MAISGKLDNVKSVIIEELESFYEVEVPAAQLITTELAERMLAVTGLLGREVAVYINRNGKIVKVSVGDDATVDLPGIKQKTSHRLSGVRCVHTHPSGDTRLSHPDISSLRSMRFDVMAAIGLKDGKIYGSMGFLSGEITEDGGYEVQGTAEQPLKVLNRYNLTQLVMLINKELGKHTMKETEEKAERAILAGVAFNSRQSGWQIEDSLDELKGLAETAGAIVVASVIQRKEKPDNAFFLGRGKVEEIGMLAQNVEADLLIIDDEISPSQQRNLELMTGLRVVDRTALILDIFAQRARSAAGKLQVELAQLKYNLPRLGGQGLVLSRLGGGIGTRGPGETKLEMDRRRIHGRIHDLEEQIERLKNQRKLHRNQRKQSRMPMAALVGYTNAGKSTILNALSGSEVLAEDKLFATLDPTTRIVSLEEATASSDDKENSAEFFKNGEAEKASAAGKGTDHKNSEEKGLGRSGENRRKNKSVKGQELLLTDTVGFIQKLPHTLVSAFQATLEETTEADLLVHVVDSSNPNYELQIKAVMEVLKEIGASEKPSIFVFNKVDKISFADREFLDDAIAIPDSNLDFVVGQHNDDAHGSGINAFKSADAETAFCKADKSIQMSNVQRELARKISFAKSRMLQDRDGVVISAKSDSGLNELRAKLRDFFSVGQLELKLCIPYTEGKLVTKLHELAVIHNTDYNESGTVLEVSIPVSEAEAFMQYQIS